MSVTACLRPNIVLSRTVEPKWVWGVSIVFGAKAAIFPLKS